MSNFSFSSLEKQTPCFHWLDRLFAFGGKEGEGKAETKANTYLDVTIHGAHM